jgi:hypothetical protein
VALMWWAIPLVGLAALAVVVAAVWLTPQRRGARRGVPLAHTARLIRLPEYRAVLRRQTRATAAVVVLATLLFAAMLVAGARPTAPVTNSSGPRADIMVCVGQPVTDPATAQFLDYFARHAAGSGTERIGLTSADRRLVPMTRDYQFAAARFGAYAQAGRVPNPPRVESFTGAVEYADYTPTVTDILGLCLTGFPGFEEPSERHRSLIYLGPGTLRSPGDDRPTVFTDAQVEEMARRGGVHIDAIATPGRPTETLAAMARASGGDFTRFDAGTLDGHLDALRAGADRGDDERRDAPTVPLVAGLALAGLLAVALLAVRR